MESGEPDRSVGQLGPVAPAARAKGAARAAASRARTKPEWRPAGTDPVARVLVDTGLAHLDRPFDYVVPSELDAAARPGVRVRVPFAGQDLDGFVIARVAAAEREGRLQRLRRVVSPDVVLTHALLATAEELARRKAGTVMDVLRLAIPPRHAAAEKALSARISASTPPDEVSAREPPPAPVSTAWAAYPAGPALLARLTLGESPGASWLAVPSRDPAEDWPQAFAEAAASTVAGGRGAVLVVPDHRDVVRLEAAVVAVLGKGRHVRLTADQGPRARYTAYLRLLRGDVAVAIGTRSAAFAPVQRPGLLAWWDDGDDLHAEPRAPYPHVHDVLLVRAEVERAALLSGGYARTAVVERLRRRDELADVPASAATVRARTPRILVAGEGSEPERDPAAVSARLPSLAWRTAKTALERGPVLVQVPRRGYLPTLSCQSCRRPARCPRCAGPLGVATRSGVPACRWCGLPASAWTCPSCGGRRWRAAVVGARRTAEELGRAFRGVPVITSGAQEVVPTVGPAPALVIATPGAEPLAAGSYAACLLLDAWALLDRSNLAAGEEALRRWMAAAALVRPAEQGGVAVLVGGPSEVSVPAVEALATWRPGWFAERELDERAAASLPPVTSAAVIEGDRDAVTGGVAELVLPGGALVLGPQPMSGGSGIAPEHRSWRAVVLAPDGSGDALAAACREVRRQRSARKEPGRLTVRLDPPDLDG